MNVMSSSARTLVGSAMASVSIISVRSIGSTSYFQATAAGTRASTSRGTSRPFSVTGGIR